MERQTLDQTKWKQKRNSLTSIKMYPKEKKKDLHNNVHSSFIHKGWKLEIINNHKEGNKQNFRIIKQQNVNQQWKGMNYLYTQPTWKTAKTLCWAKEAGEEILKYLLH